MKKWLDAPFFFPFFPYRSCSALHRRSSNSSRIRTHVLVITRRTPISNTGKYLKINPFKCYFQVADGALRCFASLADRFTRRGMDPAPLARHGLVTDLLQRLSTAGAPAPGSSMSSTPGSLSATPETKSSPSISTVISLLSTLCRGSPGITHDLLRSDLPDAIENALQGDER